MIKGFFLSVIPSCALRMDQNPKSSESFDLEYDVSQPRHEAIDVKFHPDSELTDIGIARNVHFGLCHRLPFHLREIIGKYLEQDRVPAVQSKKNLQKRFYYSIIFDFVTVLGNFGGLYFGPNFFAV